MARRRELASSALGKVFEVPVVEVAWALCVLVTAGPGNESSCAWRGTDTRRGLTSEVAEETLGGGGVVPAPLIDDVIVVAH